MLTQASALRTEIGLALPHRCINKLFCKHLTVSWGHFILLPLEHLVAGKFYLAVISMPHFICKMIMIGKTPPQAFMINSTYLVLDYALSFGPHGWKRQWELKCKWADHCYSGRNELSFHSVIHIHPSPGTSLSISHEGFPNFTLLYLQPNHCLLNFIRRFYSLIYPLKKIDTQIMNFLNFCPFPPQDLYLRLTFLNSFPLMLSLFPARLLLV